MTVPFPGYPSIPSSSSFSLVSLSSLAPSSSSPSLSAVRPPPPPGFPPLSLPSTSSSSFGFASSSTSFSSGFPHPPTSSSSSSFPVSSSSSVSEFSSRLAEFHERTLDLSTEYVDLAKWFVSCGIGVSFLDFVSCSFPHLVPDLARDFSSGSSLLLPALRSSLPVSSPSSAPFRSVPPSFAPSVPPFHARFPSSLSAPPRFPTPHPSSFPLSSAPLASLSSSSLLHRPSAPLPHAPSSSSFPPHFHLYPDGGAAFVQGAGVGVPTTSSSSSAFGVPSFPPLVPPPAPAYTGIPVTCAASAVPGYHAPAFDPHASTSAPPFEDPMFNPEDRQFDDEAPFADPSAPSLSLDLSRSEYCRMVEYVLGLFPQASGVPPSAPPPRALFESFFADSTPPSPNLHFNWFDRVRQSLTDADSLMAAFLTSGRSDSLSAFASSFVCGAWGSCEC